MPIPEDSIPQSQPQLQPDPKSRQLEEMLDSAELAEAVETGEFKHFLDYVPIAVAISRDCDGAEAIAYANKAFEALFGQEIAAVKGRDWSILDGLKHEDDPQVSLGKALQESGHDFVGTFQQEAPKPLVVEVYVSLIESEDSSENYRIVALIDVTERARAQREEFSRRIRDKEILLLELQHRVKNNLQLITAMIRLEARYQRNGQTVNLDRLAGRIESLQLLYRDLSPEQWTQAVDLGHYLSQIASAVMHTYAVDGIRLDLKVDYAPTSINVAMPVGLIVNELMTNAFKYAFEGRKTGTITVRCLHEDKTSYLILVGDDGIGFPEGKTWPMAGKLSALILQALRENAKLMDVKVETAPSSGTRVTISFAHTAPVPKVQ